MGILGGVVKPMMDMASKTSKAQKVKKISLKVKFDKSGQDADKQTTKS